MSDLPGADPGEAVRFAILSARGELFSTSSETYVTARVVGKPAELRTNAARSTQTPAWRHHGYLPYSSGDELDFTLWSIDISGTDRAIANALLPSWDVAPGERRLALRVDGNPKGELLIRVMFVPGESPASIPGTLPPAVPHAPPPSFSDLGSSSGQPPPLAPLDTTSSQVTLEDRAAEERRKRVEDRLRRMQDAGLLRPGPGTETGKAEEAVGALADAPLKLFGPLPQRAASSAPLGRKKANTPMTGSVGQHATGGDGHDDVESAGASPLQMFGGLPNGDDDVRVLLERTVPRGLGYQGILDTAALSLSESPVDVRAVAPTSVFPHTFPKGFDSQILGVVAPSAAPTAMPSLAAFQHAVPGLEVIGTVAPPILAGDVPGSDVQPYRSCFPQGSLKDSRFLQTKRSVSRRRAFGSLSKAEQDVHAEARAAWLRPEAVPPAPWDHADAGPTWEARGAAPPPWRRPDFTPPPRDRGAVRSRTRVFGGLPRDEKLLVLSRLQDARAGDAGPVHA